MPLASASAFAALLLLVTATPRAAAQAAKFPQTHSPTQAQPYTEVEDDPGRRTVPGSRAIVDRLTPELFARRAVETSRAGAELSRLALQRSDSAPVKAFAQQVIDDHEQSSEALAAIARQHGSSPRPEDGLATRQDATLEALQVIRGKRFDTAYLGAMTQHHQRSIAMFETALEPGFGDPALAAFARRTLPVLQAQGELLAQAESGAP
jgi:putative membrane protein